MRAAPPSPGAATSARLRGPKSLPTSSRDSLTPACTKSQRAKVKSQKSTVKCPRRKVTRPRSLPIRGGALSDTVREIPGPVGQLEALLDMPIGEPRAAVVFAHPLPIKGGTMHTKVVFQAAKALARIGCVVLRFNFRGVGRSAGTWDNGHGELDDYRAAADFL